MVSKDELAELARQLGTPVDFDGLIKAKVLERKGAWYRVLDPERLPEHARRQIAAMKSVTDGQVLVKFSRGQASSRKVYEQLTGRRIGEGKTGD